MKYLVIADIHSNLEAFQAVLDDTKNYGGFERVWCLGDVVGYGPDPSACIKLLKELAPLCVSGNHDQAAVGKIDVGDFNSEAAGANRWTSEQLSEDDREYLLKLPEKLVEDGFTLVHGSPRMPVWEYIAHAFTAADNFDYFDTPYCLVGHTHVPFLFEQEGEQVRESHLSDGDILMPTGKRLIINPGGVGQPRDHDPRAAYIIYDSEDVIIHHHRVPYEIGLTQDKMEAAGLPEFLVSRLGWGI